MEELNIIIVRKNIKNMYLRVKDDGVYITCNRFISKRQINKFINDNIDSINKFKEKKELDNLFKYRGKVYDVVYNKDIDIEFIDNKLFVKDKTYLDKWLSKEIKKLFLERVEICSKLFNNIPKFNIRIRNMKTRWGVCNIKTNIVTLNSRLIRYEDSVIDYVIIHELSHFIEANHSKNFWNEVGIRMPDYKKCINILKNS